MAEPLPTTHALVTRAQQGDRAAFEALVRRHEGRFRALVQSRLGPHLADQLDDVLQESLLRACRSLHRFECRGEDTFLRWLGAIAEHVILDLARRGKRRPLRLPAELRGNGDSPSGTLRREERRDRLDEAFARLSPDHRRVLELAHLEGLRAREIAERMGRSEAAVRQLIWRALKALRAQFGDTESWRLPQQSRDGQGESLDG